MVRVNLINPKQLSDNHLIAEYNEILKMTGFLRKYPSGSIPTRFCLGKGHICFFRDKLKYLKKRHEQIKKEMRKRRFAARKTLSLKGFGKQKDWRPSKKDLELIKKRLVKRVKPGFRYYREKKPKKFFIKKIKEK